MNEIVLGHTNFDGRLLKSTMWRLTCLCKNCSTCGHVARNCFRKL